MTFLYNVLFICEYLFFLLPYTYFYDGILYGTTKKHLKFWQILILFALTDIGLNSIIGMILAAPLFFYIYFRKILKKNKLAALFYAVYISTASLVIEYFYEYIFFELHLQSYTIHSYTLLLIDIALTYLTHRALIKTLDIRFTLLETKPLSGLLRQATIYLTALLCLVCTFDFYFADGANFTHRYNTTFGVLFFACFITILFKLRDSQMKYLAAEAIKQKIQENEDLNQFSQKISSLYRQIKGIRHDFASLVKALDFAINQNDMPLIRQTVDEVLAKANEQIQADAYNFFELDMVEDTALKATIFRFMNEAEQAQVEIDLEIKDTIHTADLPMLDLIRLSTILLNNALEATKLAEYPYIKVGLVQLEDELIYVIQNNRAPETIHLEELYQDGYSTKGEHRGIGLSNVLEIVKSYSNLFLDTDVTDDLFTQTITIERNR